MATAFDGRAHAFLYACLATLPAESPEAPSESNSAHQPNNSAASIETMLDSQRHLAGFVVSECMPRAACNRLNPRVLGISDRARVQQKPIFSIFRQDFAAGCSRPQRASA